MNPNLVSVIMPAYNGEPFITKAIESVLAQTYPNWELIVVDDGSTDNTAKIVSSFQDSRMVYVFQENCGQAAALNHGLELARGKYITTLDVDDWFDPNSLGERAVFLDDHDDYDVVYGDGVFCDKDGNRLKLFSELRASEVTGDVFGVMLSNSFFGTGANVMVRKSALEKYEIRYDTSIVWCQDYDLYLRLAEKCKWGYVNSIMVWYRLHHENMTVTMPSGRRLESLVRTKLKALASKRFAAIPYSQKVSFFYYILLNDLANDLKRQKDLLNHSQFKTLHKTDQARIIRLSASHFLSTRQNMKEVRELLRTSLRLNPFDWKTIFVLILAYLNKGPFKWLFDSWREMKIRNQSVPSPFDQVKG